MNVTSFFKNLKNLLIVLLIVVLLLLRQCDKKVIDDEIKIITKTETITKIDTITVLVNNYIPKWNDRILPNDTVYKNVDTSAIIKDYFITYYYTDTIADDSVKIIINDSILKNKISNRNLQYEILYPTKTITITEEHYLNKREFYVGPHVGASINALKYVGLEGLFKTKKRTAFGLGIGVDQKFEPQIQFGLYWKLGKK